MTIRVVLAGMMAINNSWAKPNGLVLNRHGRRTGFYPAIAVSLMGVAILWACPSRDPVGFLYQGGAELALWTRSAARLDRR